ncbi:hypothetical protein COT48_01675 [Candidatus Woesearchaeota archaeon CG08_land_8_20_14_0_20_47_9]|nr:MAG: hypothetical protein COV22_03995 [Candidatus Woesearchaeota archaeon CG10_big_fil_rev_8_21_14_0_10_47_5]PIO04200.1 MAG: hypothetical protein COT48_01675 [Candidatus Woesearchaeota archaeon CG08_land_8_20_14_0_20_47_9]
MANTDLVAYCGLYCPKCYKTVVSEAAKSLKTALEKILSITKPGNIKRVHIYKSQKEEAKKNPAEFI